MSSVVSSICHLQVSQVLRMRYSSTDSKRTSQDVERLPEDGLSVLPRIRSRNGEAGEVSSTSGGQRVGMLYPCIGMFCEWHSWNRRCCCASVDCFGRSASFASGDVCYQCCSIESLFAARDSDPFRIRSYAVNDILLMG